MYNLRYHIASLVAVFLALAMGLLLGTIVVERGVLESQQTQLMKDLQKDFDQVRTESAAVKKQNETLNAFADDAVPGLVDGVLASQTVLVIASPETADTAGLVGNRVRMAGGVPAVATFADRGFGLGNEKVAQAAADALGVPVTSVTSQTVAAALALEWTVAGAPRPLTKALVSADALTITGLPSALSAEGTVFACSYDGTFDPAALSLAKAMADASHPALGVETTDRKDGCATAARAAGLSGVDNVDTSLGQVSLTWILAGRATGLYGDGAGAKAPYPSPLYGEQ